MIKQIAAPLQILSGAKVLLRARHAVVSSINYHGVGGASVPLLASHNETHAKPCTRSNRLQNSLLKLLEDHIYVCQYIFGTSRNVSVV